MTVRLLVLFLTPGLVLLALSPLAPAAHGTTPTEGSGTLQVISLTPLDQRLAGPNVVFSEANTFTTTGTLLGTLVCQVSGLVRPTGEGTAHATCTFTGTVQGQHEQQVIFNMPRQQEILFNMLITVLAHAPAQFWIGQQL